MESDPVDIVVGCDYGEAPNANGLCEKCPYGKYTVELNSISCKTCPSD